MGQTQPEANGQESTQVSPWGIEQGGEEWKVGLEEQTKEIWCDLQEVPYLTIF